MKVNHMLRNEEVISFSHGQGRELTVRLKGMMGGKGRVLAQLEAASPVCSSPSFNAWCLQSGVQETGWGNTFSCILNGDPVSQHWSQ